MCEVIHVPRCEQAYEVSIASFRDDARRLKMIKRCQEVGLSANVYHFTENDPRINDVSTILGNPDASKHFVVIFNWLRLCHDFYYHSTKSWCVMMEDDIYLSKSIIYNIPHAIAAMQQLNVDIMLLGYLMTCTPDQAGYQKVSSDSHGFSYYSYPDDLWGSHCFVISKTQAKYFLDKYTNEYIATLQGTGGDWIFTKDGPRAMMYPPLAVEEGYIKCQDHWGQISFHRNCSDYQYNNSYTK
ncbi:MAG TPA: hypothetical protein VLG50_05630 [Candidatus Saccharimonadales bacterium]|nr:hypothetical protein [Candidatus Saccharimonadales bacterium]